MLRFVIKLYLLLVFAFAVAVFIVPRLINAAFYDYWADFARSRITGSIYVIEQSLLTTPLTERTKQVAKMNEHFDAIKIELLSQSEIELSTEELATLRSGGIVARLDDDEYFHKLPDSEQALHLFVPGLPNSVLFINWLTYIAIIAVVLAVLMVWAWPHWRDLQRLKETAEQLGRGDLAARTVVSPRSTIAKLVQRFNDMADRIQHLLSWQRDMINAVSHELRTPIARLEFGVALLKSAKTSEQLADRLADFSKDVRELDQLVAELLSYTRLDQLDRAPETELVSLGQLVDSVVGSVVHELETRAIDCQVSFNGKTDLVTVDPRIIARAVVNLLGNAIRYCNSRINITMTAKPDGSWTLAVEDDGIGVPEADRDKIFEPFFRLDRSRDRATGGFGLGLAIVHRAVESHHGCVYVEKSPWGGARFVIEVPGPG